MPDITMCVGENCQLRDSCYRFRAKPSKYQSYGQFPNKSPTECDDYQEIELRPNAELQAPDSRTDRFNRRKRNLSCSHCPPHKAENSGRRAKHGPKKPKYKDK